MSVEEVEIVTGADLGRPFTVIGAITARAEKRAITHPGPPTIEEVNAKLREVARRKGANAVINVQYKHGISAMSWKALTASGTAVVVESVGRLCPSCAETIKPQAIVCRFCGRDVPKADLSSSAGAATSTLDSTAPESDVIEATSSVDASGVAAETVVDGPGASATSEIANSLAKHLNEKHVTEITGDEVILAEEPYYSRLDWKIVGADANRRSVGLRGADGAFVVTRPSMDAPWEARPVAAGRLTSPPRGVKLRRAASAWSGLSKGGKIVTVILLLAALGGVLRLFGYKGNQSTRAATPTANPIGGRQSSSWATDAQASAVEITSLFSQINAAAQDQDVSLIATLCGVGEGDMPGWRATVDAVPIASVRVPFESALDSYEQAFPLCASGTEGGLRGAAAYIRAGTASIHEATAAAQAYVQP